MPYSESTTTVAPIRSASSSSGASAASTSRAAAGRLGAVGPEPLQVVVEVRHVGERQVGARQQPAGRRRRSTALDLMDGGRAPVLEQRELAELADQLVVQLGRPGVAVGRLLAVGVVDRPRGHGPVGRRAHGVPPADVGDRVARAGRAGSSPTPSRPARACCAGATGTPRRARGSTTRCRRSPCSAGGRPVRKVDCTEQVTAGSTVSSTACEPALGQASQPRHVPQQDGGEADDVDHEQLAHEILQWCAVRAETELVADPRELGGQPCGQGVVVGGCAAGQHRPGVGLDLEVVDARPVGPPTSAAERAAQVVAAVAQRRARVGVHRHVEVHPPRLRRRRPIAVEGVGQVVTDRSGRDVARAGVPGAGTGPRRTSASAARAAGVDGVVDHEGSSRLGLDHVEPGCVETLRGRRGVLEAHGEVAQVEADARSARGRRAASRSTASVDRLDHAARLGLEPDPDTAPGLGLDLRPARRRARRGGSAASCAVGRPRCVPAERQRARSIRGRRRRAAVRPARGRRRGCSRVAPLGPGRVVDGLLDHRRPGTRRTGRR